MIRVLIVAIFLLNISAVYGQRTFMRGGDEGAVIVTDSMLKYEKYLYTQPEIAPAYPGGHDAFDLFIKKNLKYPAKAVENGTQGRVALSFIVEKSGRLTHITIARGIGDDCDEEAVRLLKKGSKWSPGKIHNIPVRTQFSVGIKFIKPDSDD